MPKKAPKTIYVNPPCDYLIADDYFINTAVDYDQYLHWFDAFPDCQLSRHQKDFIFVSATNAGINPYVICIKLEQEQGLIRNTCGGNYDDRESKAMGYNIRDNRNIGFYKQIDRGGRCLRRHFDAWKRGAQVTVDGFFLRPQNAATYALYRYTPWFGVVPHYIKPCKGNLLFVQLSEILFRTPSIILNP